MKYLFRLDETFEKNYSRSQSKSNAPKINRAELLAQIEAAESEDNWEQVAELLELLKGLNESIILDWQGHSLLLESVQEGKAIVQKIANSEFEKERARLRRESDSTEGEAAEEKIKEGEERLKKKIDQKYFGPNSEFEKIKRMLNFQGPIAAFVRFRYDQLAPPIQIGEDGKFVGTLADLHQLTTTTLKDYVNQLPMTVDAYSKLPYNPSGVGQGWEKLGDALADLLELQGGNWLISKLPKDALRKSIENGYATGVPVNLREEFKKAPRELQLELQREAARLNKLNKPLLIKAFLHKLPSCKSIEQVLNDLKIQVKNADNVDRVKLLETAMQNYPSVAVLYDGKDHMVFSFRSDAQMPFLCRKAQKWCIQPRWYNETGGKFWTYAKGGRLQVGILDFTVDNNYHTVGVTVDPDGSIYAMHNQPDYSVKNGVGRDYRSVLRGFECGSDGKHSYPEELIQAIDENFKQEVSIKKQTEPIYQKITKYAENEKTYEGALIKTIVGLVNDLKSVTQSAKVTEDDLKVSSEKNIVNQIVAAELKNVRNSPEMEKVQSDMIQKYSGGGHVLPSPADLKLFEIILEDSPLLTEGVLDRMSKYYKEVVDTMGKIAATMEGVETPLAKRLRLLYASVKNTITAIEALKEKIKK